MEDVFITKIHVNKVRHLEDMGIVLCGECEKAERRHLILTGKNGSGKTRMFPNVQFIVSTHSPFVITSIANRQKTE